MRRREFLATAAAASLASPTLFAPALAQPASTRVLKFVPAADLVVLDPLVTTAYPTRNHGHLVWDTLYGLNEALEPRPQLAEGHVVEDGGLRWTFTLREGPKFHDGEPVRAKDAVASIARWMKRDTHGQTMAERVSEMRVIDDRRFEIRLSRPFGVLLSAIGKASSYPCFIMPERLAANDPGRAIAEIVGSGPYLFKADERVSGSRTVYARNDAYVPRQDAPSLTSGAKLAHFERLEWTVQPDPSTASAALQAGEVDMIESVSNDLRPLLERARGVRVEQIETSGTMAMLRPNHLHAPFDDPEARRAMLKAIVQSDYMTAVMGSDRSLWADGIGCFPPASPLASDEGIAAVSGPRDFEAAKRVLAGRAPVTMLLPSEIPNNNALTLVAIDAMRRAGLTVEPASSDWGTILGRRAKKDPPAAGGWNAVVVLFAGMDLGNPGAHPLLRGNGGDAWFGWPTSPTLEQLRNDWFDAPDLNAQKAIGRKVQAAFWQDVPFWPLGQYFIRTAYRSNLAGVLKGMVLPLNLKRA